jgi:hypothetical protein
MINKNFTKINTYMDHMDTQTQLYYLIRLIAQFNTYLTFPPFIIELKKIIILVTFQSSTANNCQQKNAT